MKILQAIAGALAGGVLGFRLFAIVTKVPGGFELRYRVALFGE